MQKTFNIRFKEVGTGAYKAFAPQKTNTGYTLAIWKYCPKIENCPVSRFLDELNFEPSGEIMLKVTIKTIK